MKTLLIFFILIFFRAFPRILCPNAIASDTAFHLHMAEEIRKNNFRIPRTHSRFFFKNRFDYPYLYHFLLALFPSVYRDYAERFSSVFFDAVLFWLIYYFTLLMFPGTGDSIASYACLIFTFHPALLKFGNGPRIHYGSPRILGQIFYALHIIFVWLFFEQESIFACFLSILCVSFIILSSKFSFQVLILLTPAISIIAYSNYFLIPIFGILLSFLVTRGDSYLIISGSLKHSVYYFSNLQKNFIWPYHTSILAYVKNISKYIHNISCETKKFIFYIYTNRNPINVLVFFYPELSVFSFSFLCLNNNIPDLQVSILVGAVICLFLTEAKQFMFLGDGERYVQYALPLLLPSVANFFSHSPLIIFIFCLYGLCFYAIGLILFYKSAYSHFILSFENKNLFSHINSLPTGNILTIGPYQWIALYYTKHTLIIGGLNLDKSKLSREDFDLIYKNMPYPSEKLCSIISRFSVDYILTDKEHYNKYIKSFFNTEIDFLKHIEKKLETNQLLFFFIKKPS